MQFEDDHDYDCDRDDPQSIDIDPDDADKELATVACVECGAEVIAGIACCPRCGSFAFEHDRGASPATRIVAVLLVGIFLFGVFWWLRRNVF